MKLTDVKDKAISDEKDWENASWVNNYGPILHNVDQD